MISKCSIWPCAHCVGGFGAGVLAHCQPLEAKAPTEYQPVNIFVKPNVMLMIRKSDAFVASSPLATTVRPLISRPVFSVRAEGPKVVGGRTFAEDADGNLVQKPSTSAPLYADEIARTQVRRLFLIFFKEPIYHSCLFI